VGEYAYKRVPNVTGAGPAAAPNKIAWEAR